ncbi:MAG: ATP-binding protein [Planctomycetota bacterium]
MRSRLLVKLYACFVSIILLAAAITWYLLEQQLVDDVQKQIRSELEEKSQLAAELVLDSLERSHGELHQLGQQLQRRFQRLGDRLPTRLTLVLPDGRVLADSDEDPLLMDNHRQRKELQRSLEQENGVSVVVRYSNTLAQEMMYLARVLEGVADDGPVRHLGWLRVAVPLRFLHERRSYLRMVVTLGVLVAVLAALVLGFIMARNLTRPLDQLSQAAQALARGEQRSVLPRPGRDEVGALVRSFDRMAKELEQRIRTISTDRQKLLTILSDMHEGVIAIDAEERILHSNAVAQNLLPVEPGVVVGQLVWQVVHNERVCRELTQTLHDAGDRSWEQALAGSRGRGRSLALHVSPLHDDDRQVIGAVMVVTDQTERRRLDDMRRDFVANVSHELKTPLTVIQGILETIEEDPDMPASMRRRFLDKARAHTVRLSNLVADLLMLSHLEAQDESMELESVDLRRAIEQAVGGISEAAQAAHIHIVTEAMPEPLRLRGEAEALRQVFDNLLSNAIRYSPPRTRVTVRARREGGSIHAEVSDQGIGIPPQAQRRIFERFYRVDKARSRALGGTGLGLSIVKHYVLAHGGEISVDSEIGVGTTFRLRFPPDVAEL